MRFSSSFSRMTTRAPESDACNAAAQPAIPEPITTTSKLFLCSGSGSRLASTTVAPARPRAPTPAPTLPSTLRRVTPVLLATLMLSSSIAHRRTETVNSLHFEAEATMAYGTGILRLPVHSVALTANRHLVGAEMWRAMRIRARSSLVGGKRTDHRAMTGDAGCGRRSGGGWSLGVARSAGNACSFVNLVKHLCKGRGGRRETRGQQTLEKGMPHLCTFVWIRGYLGSQGTPAALTAVNPADSFRRPSGPATASELCAN